MLHKLFGSQARVKILKLFLTNPDKKFYIRQISRDLKLQLNSVRRELENLEQFGLLVSNPSETSEEDDVIMTREDFIRQTKSASEKNKKKSKDIPLKLEKKYYQANRGFVLYEEIKALIIKAQMLYERDFIEKLYKAGKPKLLILTGFFVGDPDKPVDLFVVGKINKQRFTKLIRELEDDLGREINYTQMGLREFRYRRDITDIFLYDILEGRKLVVIDEYGVS